MSSISFSSIVAFSTAEGSAFYGVSKCAVAGLSDGLRKEVEPLGIKIMVGEPGPFKTDFFTDPLLSINTILKTTKIQIGKEKSE